eukprot:gene8425-250_t
MEITRKSVEEKVFKNWINSVLQSKGILVNNFFYDLSDGVVFAALYETLTGNSLGKYTKKPKLKVQKYMIINLVLSQIKEQIQNPPSSEKIVECDETTILEFVWWFIWQFQLQNPNDNLPETELKFLFSIWCKNQLNIYKNLAIFDFEQSWNSGFAFCALFDSFIPNIIQFSKLSYNPKDNLQLVFDLSEKYLKIPKLLDAKEISICPDERSIILYLSYFRNLKSSNLKIMDQKDSIDEPVVNQKINTNTTTTNSNSIDFSEISSYFVSFIKSNSLKKMDFETQKKVMYEFDKIYNNYKIGNFECIELDELCMKGLEKSKNSEIITLLKNGTYSRSDLPQEKVLKELKDSFENVEFSDDLENFIEEEAKKRKKLKQNRSEIYDSILLELYNDWKNEKSMFIVEIDKILNFKPKNHEKSKLQILKMIKNQNISNVDYNEILFDFETKLYSCKDYFDMCDGGEADKLNVFFHLNWENHVLKNDIKALKNKTSKLEDEVKELKSIVYCLLPQNSEIPQDAVFIPADE